MLQEQLAMMQQQRAMMEMQAEVMRQKQMRHQSLRKNHLADKHQLNTSRLK